MWRETLRGNKFESTTIFPSQAWNNIPIKTKKLEINIILFFLKYLIEKINKIKVDNPAKAPRSLFINSIHVWVALNSA